MNVSLGEQLEKLVEDQVKTGLYQNNSEVVRDALRHLFLQDDSDDTELLAQCLREAKLSPRKAYTQGEFRKFAARALSRRRLAAGLPDAAHYKNRVVRGRCGWTDKLVSCR